jgi:hypothetical protein
MMLFTGLHHAREPLSVSMNIYILAKLLFDAQHNDIKTINLLKNVVYW